MIYSGDDEVVEEEDPRYELIRRLLEYKRYKDASADIAEYEEEQRKVYYRNDYTGDYRIDDRVEEDESIQNLTLYNLIKAFKYAMDHRPKEVVHNIMRFNVTLEEQVEFVINECIKCEYVSFLNMINSMHEKLRIVVTFIAILEMIKNGILGIKINESLTDFEIFKTGDLPEDFRLSEI
jgi:segregation and condensation protein A